MKVFGLCRFATQPELITTTGGGKVLRGSVAWSYGYKKTKNTAFYNVAAFGKLAETMAQYFNKGDEFVLFGNLIMNKYTDRNGKKVQKAHINITEFSFTTGNKKKEAAPADPDAEYYEDGGFAEPY